MSMPMFPLGSVLFPGQVLPLHIFEPRYQQMLQHCLATTNEFGVVLIERGQEVGGNDIRSGIGTVATIIETAEARPGHWAVIAAGVRRIRVQRWNRDDPWPNAEVIDYPDEADDPGDPTRTLDTAQLWRSVQRRFQQVRALAAEVDGTAVDVVTGYANDPATGSFHLAALSPLGQFDRQQVLAAAGLHRRLVLLSTLLDDAAETLEATLTFGSESPEE